MAVGADVRHALGVAAVRLELEVLLLGVQRVLVELLAVVRREQDQGVVQLALLFQEVEQHAEANVDAEHLAVNASYKGLTYEHLGGPGKSTQDERVRLVHEVEEPPVQLKAMGGGRARQAIMQENEASGGYVKWFKERGGNEAAEKIAKAEALIASATDLESLQRYEDALRSGKLGDVLKSAELV